MNSTTPVLTVEAVQNEFINEIQKKGMDHVLEWIDTWYAKCAEAQVSEFCKWRVVENTEVQSAFEGHELLANLITKTEGRSHSVSWTQSDAGCHNSGYSKAYAPIAPL